MSPEEKLPTERKTAESRRLNAGGKELQRSTRARRDQSDANVAVAADGDEAAVDERKAGQCKLFALSGTDRGNSSSNSRS